MINKNISKERLKLIEELFNNQKELNRSMENQVIDVLVENRMEKQSKLFGRNKYITPVIFDACESDIGKDCESKNSK